MRCPVLEGSTTESSEGPRVRRSQRLNVYHTEANPYTPAFLRKSAEAIDWKRVDEHSWSKERQENEKERRGIVPKREKWVVQRGTACIGGDEVENSQDMVARKRKPVKNYFVV